MTYPRLAAALLAIYSLGLLAAPTLAADNPLARPSDAPKPFAGEFSGGNVKLSLTFNPAAKAYRGELSIGDAKYPCTATETSGSLAGTFIVDGQSYAFTATLAGDTLGLTSDGNTHRLTRAAAARPQNPLGGGPPAPPPAPMPAPQPANPPAANNGPAGGVGIGFEPTDDGLVIRALMPDGAGEKAKLQPGGILRAVDGKDIEGMPPEQIRMLLAGAPGTMVKLTIEYPNEVTDAILQRTALNQPQQQPPQQPPQAQQPQPQPNRELVPQPGNEPRVAPPGNRPMVNGLGILKPGLRVTYFSGSSSMPGARTTLVQDDNGNWIDPGTGQRFAEADNPATGGAGLMQITVVAADQRDLAVDSRTYVYMDINQGLTVTSGLTSYVGTPDGLGEFWQPPAKLAAMREGEEGGQRVRRLQYPVNGKTFNAITITNTAGGNGTYSRNVFDLETGLLIAASSSTTGQGQLAPNPNGTAGPVGGVTMIASTRLMDIRQVDTPWIAQSLPAWAKPNTILDYSGTYSTVMEGAPAMQPWQLQARLSIGDARTAWMPVKQQSRLNSGMGQPQDSETLRALGAGVLDPIWIDPQILARLQPNTVLDEDKITKRKTTYLGQQGGVAVFGEQAPYEQRQYGYDLRTGTLVSIDSRQQQGPATIVSKLQLTQQP